MVKKLDAIKIYEIAESGNTERRETQGKPPNLTVVKVYAASFSAVTTVGGIILAAERSRSEARHKTLLSVRHTLIVL